MAVETVATTDGGRVEYWVEQDPGSSFRGVFHVQKYDSSGQKVGGEYTTQMNTTAKYGVWALPGGGYVVGVTNNTMDGLTLVGGVFTADATLARSLSGGSRWDLEVSSDGGFLVGSVSTQHHSFTFPDARLALYDNTGGLVRSGVISAPDGPQITVDGEGVFHASWTDGGGNAHTLAIDPQNPPQMSSPPAPDRVGFVDDVGPSQGVNMAGGGTDDNTPTVRVTVSEVGWVAYEFAYTPSFPGNAPTNPSRFVQATAEDVARGYVEIPVPAPLSDGNYELAARFQNANGFVGPEESIPLRIDTQAPTSPTVIKAVDNQGDQQGDLSSGASTDDTTPTFHISLTGTGAQPFDGLLLFDNGRQINFLQIDQAAVQQGYITFTPTLAAGSHSITAAISDFAGNRSPASAAFNLTVASEAPPHVVGSDFGVSEANLPNGTRPDVAALTKSGAITVNSSAAIDDIVVDGVNVLQDGVFTAANIAALGGTLRITGWDAAAGRLSWSYTLENAVHHERVTNNGANDFTVRDFFHITATDVNGRTGGTHMALTVNDDNPLGSDEGATAASGGPAVTGNVLLNDKFGGDGGGILWVSGQGGNTSDNTYDANGNLVVEGRFGTLTLHRSGDYSYAPRAGVVDGAIDTFQYVLQDADGDRTPGKFPPELRITFSAAQSEEGRVIHSPGPGSTVTGGSGNDTLVASPGPDRLTGGAGADVFEFPNLPWNAGRITDFAVGVDRLNLDNIFATTGYTGTDPVADGRMTFQSDGAGGTRIYFDRDAPNSGDWPFLITTLDGVSPSGLTWGQLSRGSAPPPPGETLVSFGAVSVEKPEGHSGSAPFQYTLSRTGDLSGSTTVQWKVIEPPLAARGSAATADDFVGGAYPSGTVTFAPGETSKLVTVHVAGDTRTEPDEIFYLGFHAITGGKSAGEQAYGRGVILNDDGSGPPIVGFQTTSVTKAEGSSGVTSFQYTVTRSGDVSGTTGVHYTVTGEGANPATGPDFADGRMPVGSLHFLPGETSKVLTIHVVGDTMVEPTERFRITLDDISNGGLSSSVATGEILNDDTGDPGGGDGQVITSQRYGDTLVGGSGADTLIAGQGPDRMTGQGGGDTFVFRDTPWNAGVVTDFAIGSDRIDISQVLQRGGYTGSDPVRDGWVRFEDSPIGAQVLVDTDGPSGGNTIWFKMTSLQGVLASSLTWANVSGGGSPPPPGTQIAFVGSGIVQAEGGATTTTIYSYTVSRTGDVSGSSSATWSVAGSGANPASADDFVGGAFPGGTVTFAAGETSKTVEVRVQGDTTLEPDEDFTVTLAGAAGASLGRTTVSGRIVNDDNPTGQAHRSDQYGDTLVGGDGHDTLIAGQGPDQLTGGAGRDLFVWENFPWNAGRVTDFFPGVDKLDLRALFDQAGYTGTDPIADRRLEFRSDGQGNTQVYVDRDQPDGGDWPFLITTLQGVSPGQIGPGDWLF